MSTQARKEVAAGVSGDIIDVIPVVPDGDGGVGAANTANTVGTTSVGAAGSACGNHAAAGAVSTGSASAAGEAASQEAPRSSFPTTADFESELKRVKTRRRFRRVLGGVLGVLLVIAAAAVLLATRFFPVLQIYGNSMTPTLNEGEIVVAFDLGELEQGDVVAFYHNNKVLVKRVIASAGDWVDIRDDGTVYVNDRRIEEPYIDQAALGSCNITLPYQVPESHVFVMGDHRLDSIDSRNTAVGCVGEDQIIGEIVVRVWPLETIGLLQ